ncbi:hypothetical protein CDG81_20785 [Actinopolyspora erythraea]|uniref:DUF1071 domain-containing protein n=1 Tax=Actinopolyspora erythraea TaxID=414996 RepID=A0A099D9P0_9ACTN|nr:hypothetical protein [Actinopolyspora erythraea]ASU80301.1 hypothetical protein CDG81_20785 [Actinopolyspora erythraea]KGI82616.1 hypothetical protein IL38_04095 [Actinopolyspora erythraea]
MSSPEKPSTTTELVRDPWLKQFYTKQGTPGSGNIKRFVDFRYSFVDYFKHWEAYYIVMEGSPDIPVTVHLEFEYPDLMLPPGAPEDAKVVDLNGWGNQGYIQQEIPTTKGVRYTLSYWVGFDMHEHARNKQKMAARGYVLDGYSRKELNEETITVVHENGTVKSQGKSPKPNWKKAETTFTAQSALTVIRLVDWTGPIQDSSKNRIGTTGVDVTGISVRKAGISDDDHDDDDDDHDDSGKDRKQLLKELEECRKNCQRKADDAYREGRRDAWRDAWKRYKINKGDQ